MGFPGGSVGKRMHLQRRDMRVWSLSQENPQEGIATHSSISAWRIPWTQKPGRIQPTGSPRVGHVEVSEQMCMHYIACFRFKSESEVAQLCPTLCDPMHYSPPGSSVQGTLQARILGWVDMPSSRGSSQSRDQTYVSLLHWQAGSLPLAPPRKPQMSEVAQSSPTLCNPVDCSPPGSSVHGILQARILEWVAISFSRGSSQPRDRTQVSCIKGRCFNLWARWRLTLDSVRKY